MQTRCIKIPHHKVRNDLAVSVHTKTTVLQNLMYPLRSWYQDAHGWSGSHRWLILPLNNSIACP